jgi:hypothetical protein
MTNAFTARQILAFWAPLAASWALMSAEGPLLQAVIARLPEVETQLAAFGIMMSVEITVESPVIMLLATSTALVSGPRSFHALRRFMICVNAVVTITAALVAFTPLYDLIVRDLIGVPPPIAAAAQPGMQIMTFWSAAIGWRRFYQGVLIRHGETRWIGYGTVARLVASAGSGIAVAVATNLRGVPIAAGALMIGVAVEAVFIAWAVRPTVKRIEAAADREPVAFRDVFRYHAPLAATSFLTLLAQPLVGAGLARMPSPEESLAAWPVVWGVLFIFRSPAFALPEVVIALVAARALFEPLRRFCGRVGAASSAGLAIVALTPAVDLYLRYLAGLPDRLARFVVPGLVLGAAIPFLNAWHSWFRGLLMAARSTPVIYRGMGVNLAVMGAAIAGGVVFQTPGVITAVAALIVSFAAEIAYLRPRALAAAL